MLAKREESVSMILKRRWTLTGLMVPESLPGGPSHSDQSARRPES